MNRKPAKMTGTLGMTGGDAKQRLIYARSLVLRLYSKGNWKPLSTFCRRKVRCLSLFFRAHSAVCGGCCLVTKLCPTLYKDPMDCSLLGSFVHGIFQVRILEWVVIYFSKTTGFLSVV